MRHRALPVVLAVSSALALGACGGSGSTKAGPKADLTLQADAFSPLALTVAPGSTVTISNPSSMTHDVVASAGGVTVRTSAITPGGHTSFVAPTAPGTYKLTCDYHPDMQATLTVS